MSENTVFIRQYNIDENSQLAIVNEKEVWRYAGYMGIPKADDELNDILSEVIKEALGVISYKVCYRRMEIGWENEKSILPFLCDSKDLDKCLKGCDEIVMFAATIGLGIDRLVTINQRSKMTKSLLLQALGAERVEALCDRFCNEIKEELSKERKIITPRYSPGYGDMPLDKQVDFFKLLDCNRKIGISLGESLLMTPSKSVTAIFGIKDCIIGEDSIGVKEHKCLSCNNINCEYRRENM